MADVNVVVGGQSSLSIPRQAEARFRKLLALAKRDTRIHKIWVRLGETIHYRESIVAERALKADFCVLRPGSSLFR